MTDDDRYKYRIVDVCDELHGWATQGDPNGMPLHEALDQSAWLHSRVEHWSFGPNTSQYDGLIRQLAQVTLAEVDKCFDELSSEIKARRVDKPDRRQLIQRRDDKRKKALEDNKGPTWEVPKRCNARYDDGIADGNLTACSTYAGCGQQGCPYKPLVRYRCCHCRMMNDHKPGEPRSCSDCGSSTFPWSPEDA